MARWLLATQVLIPYLRDPKSAAATWLATKPIHEIAVCGLSLAWIVAASDGPGVPAAARSAWRAQIASFRTKLALGHGTVLGLDLADLTGWEQIYHKPLSDPQFGEILAEERFVVAQAFTKGLIYVSPQRAWLQTLATENALVWEAVA